MILKAQRTTSLSLAAAMWTRVPWEGATGQVSWLSGSLLTLPPGFAYEIISSAYFSSSSALYYAIEPNGPLASDFFQFAANDLSNYSFINDIVPAGSITCLSILRSPTASGSLHFILPAVAD